MTAALHPSTVGRDKEQKIAKSSSDALRLGLMLFVLMWFVLFLFGHYVYDKSRLCFI